MNQLSTLRPFLRRAALAGGLAALLTGAAQAQSISGFSPQGGVAGTQITISGLALGNTSAVLLNGQPMPIVSKTTTQVVVKIPSAASSGKLLLVSTVGGVSTSAVSGNVLFATRSSAGTYLPQVGSSAAIASTGTTAGQYTTPTFADLNNDGVQELLVGYADGSIKSFSFNTATNTFAAGVSLTNTTNSTVFTTVGGTAGNYAKPTVTDLDGDGLLDIIVGTGTNQTLARYEQTPATTDAVTAFGAQELLTYNTTASATYNTIDMGYNFPRPVVTDLDGNGKLDMLVGDDNGQLARFEQVDNTTNAARFTTLSTGYNYLKLASGSTIDVGFTSKPQVTDLDGNGKIDLLVGNRAGNVLRYEQAATNGLTFVDRGTVAYTSSNTAIKVGTNGTDNNYAAPAIGDLDGDGIEDLAMGANDGTILRYEQAIVTPSPLPVVLTAFGAEATAAGVQLTWATAQEKNSAFFAVERSLDGKTFSTLGQVEAAGTTTTARQYRYLDAAATAGTRYYRLRQVDQDGTTEYSGIVAVSVPAKASVAVRAEAFPNPFTDALYVSLPAGSEAQLARVVLTTAAGQPVYSGQLQLQATPQALAALPTLAPGIYVLRLTTAGGTTTLRVVRR